MGCCQSAHATVHTRNPTRCIIYAHAPLLAPAQPLAHALARHQPRGACYVRESGAIEVRAHAPVERGARERQRTLLGRVEDEVAERRHRVRAGAIGPDELEVDGLGNAGRERVVAVDGHRAPAGRVRLHRCVHVAEGVVAREGGLGGGGDSGGGERVAVGVEGAREPVGRA